MKIYKILSVLLVGLFLIAILSLSFAIAKKDKNATNVTDTDSNGSRQNKTTYGLCVSESAKLKNACFRETKQNYKTCRQNVKDYAANQISVNKTEIRQRLRDCKQEYKQAMKICKSSFKQAKISCIQYKCKNNETFVNSTCVRQ